jgi:membrane-bound serine protease (ClpP class)
MSSLVWAIVILILGLVLLLAEVFIPSAGTLLVLAIAALVGSVVLAFQEGRDVGITFTILVVVLIPTVVGVGFHYWPRTPMGRRMMLTKPSEADIDDSDAHDRALRALVGQVGRTVTPLLPCGISDFAGHRVDTMAEGVGIEPGTMVRVVSVQGKRVLVRAVSAEGIADLNP